MTKKPTSIALNDTRTPIPVNMTIQHIDSTNSTDEHVDADALVMTTQLGMLMQMWHSVDTLNEMCQLSDQLMKVLHKRRELCLKPTSKADVKDDKEIDITPI